MLVSGCRAIPQLAHFGSLNRATLAGGQRNQQADGEGEPKELAFPGPSRSAFARVDLQPQMRSSQPVRLAMTRSAAALLLT